MPTKSRCCQASALLFAFALASPALADPVEDFYRNKTIDLVIGYTPGGAYDLYAGLVGRYLEVITERLTQIIGGIEQNLR